MLLSTVLLPTCQSHPSGYVHSISVPQIPEQWLPELSDMLCSSVWLTRQVRSYQHLGLFLHRINLCSRHTHLSPNHLGSATSANFYMEWFPKLTWVICKYLSLSVPWILICKMGLLTSTACSLNPWILTDLPRAKKLPINHCLCLSHCEQDSECQITLETILESGILELRTQGACATVSLAWAQSLVASDVGMQKTQ